jgi:hypothetical protein
MNDERNIGNAPVDGLRGRLGGRIEELMGRTVGGLKLSWGLLVLLAVALYAIVNVVRVLVYFFN